MRLRVVIVKGILVTAFENRCDFFCFPRHANVLVTKELFTMRVIVVSVLGRLPLRILEDILSIPGALLDGSLLITFPGIKLVRSPSDGLLRWWIYI